MQALYLKQHARLLGARLQIEVPVARAKMSSLNAHASGNVTESLRICQPLQAG